MMSEGLTDTLEENASSTASVPQHDLTSLVVPLLKSVLYRDEDAQAWAALLKLQARVRDLPRLTVEEGVLFDELRDHRLRVGVRLEQERIGFGWLQQALAALPLEDQSWIAAPRSQ